MAGSSIDEVQTLLDDHVIKTQTMKGSPYAAEFKERLDDWESYLTGVQDVVDVWLKAGGKGVSGGKKALKCGQFRAGKGRKRGVSGLFRARELGFVLPKHVQVQGVWLYLEPIFSSEESPPRMPRNYRKTCSVAAKRAIFYQLYSFLFRFQLQI